VGVVTAMRMTSVSFGCGVDIPLTKITNVVAREARRAFSHCPFAKPLVV
jgi:hypothetical protein